MRQEGTGKEVITQPLKVFSCAIAKQVEVRSLASTILRHYTTTRVYMASDYKWCLVYVSMCERLQLW